jgi:hypothetical protein
MASRGIWLKTAACPPNRENWIVLTIMLITPPTRAVIRPAIAPAPAPSPAVRGGGAFVLRLPRRGFRQGPTLSSRQPVAPGALLPLALWSVREEPWSSRALFTAMSLWT